MFETVQVTFLAAVLFVLRVQVCAQGFYATYNTPLQNSFAFATPHLKQMFTTKLTSGPHIQQFSQQLQDQQTYSVPQQNVYSNLPQQYQQQQILNLPANFIAGQNNGLFSTAPQQFDDQYLRQQATYQPQKLEQNPQYQYLEQFQAPFFPNQRGSLRSLQLEKQNNQDEERENNSNQNLLGVAYSPSTKVSQVKFDSGKLKYDF